MLPRFPANFLQDFSFDNGQRLIHVAAERGLFKCAERLSKISYDICLQLDNELNFAPLRSKRWLGRNARISS